MSFVGVITKLKAALPQHQARVHKDVLAAKSAGLHVSVRFSEDEDDGYVIFTMTREEVENYRGSGGQWTYISASEFLNNTSSFSY